MAKDIDEIILVGGSTRMLQVQQKLEQAYGKPISSFEPDKAVAMGAALVADGASYSGGGELPGSGATGGSRHALDGESGAVEVHASDGSTIIFHETCTKSYGIVASVDGREVISNLIFKDTPKPAHAEGEYVTSKPNQTSLNLRVYESGSLQDTAELTDGTQMYESCEVALEPGLPDASPINIIFDLDANGELDLTAIDVARGKPTKVRMKRIGAKEANAGMDAIKRARLT